MDSHWTQASVALVEADSGAVGQCPRTPGAHDAASMYEQLLVALIGNDVPVAVLFVEPFHSAAGQEPALLDQDGKLKTSFLMHLGQM